MLHYPISINVILKNVSLFLPETTGPYKKTQPLAGFLFIHLRLYLTAHGNPARSVNSWTSQNYEV